MFYEPLVFEMLFITFFILFRLLYKPGMIEH